MTSHAEPAPEPLAEETGVPEKFAAAVQEDERWKKERAVQVIREKERFWQLLETVKYSDYSYVLKFNFMLTF